MVGKKSGYSRGRYTRRDDRDYQSMDRMEGN